MSSLKRKLNDSAPNSTSKPTKKQKLAPAPKKLPKSEEIVIDSTDDEPVQTKPKLNITEIASAGQPNGKRHAEKSKKRSPGAKASREAARFADDFMSLPRDERNYAELISISSMSESSEDDGTNGLGEDDTHTGKAADQGTAKLQNNADEDTDNSVGSEEQEQTGSESESEERTAERPLKTVEAQSHPIPPDPPPPYDPPLGFRTATIASSTKIRKLFTKEKLSGKQIWHITAPASVPIESIQEVPVQKVTSGASITSHKNADYGLITEADINSTEKVLLVPSSEGNVYTMTGTTIDKTLHLQQIVSLPSTAKLSGRPVKGGSSLPKTHIKAVRQQPTGLKMRYRPFGDEPQYEGSDSAPRFRKPPITTPTSSAKRYRPVEPDDKISPAKKPSQNSSGKAADVDVATSSPRSKSRPEHPLTEYPDGIAAKERTEEKAKRKAEKKRRREQKASSPDKASDANETGTMILPSKEHEGLDRPVARVNGTAEMSKAKKDRGAGGSGNTLEVASSQRSSESQAALSTAIEDARLGQVEPEKMKPKRKKRKSEATEEA
ncbi:MAG: hypothetical protein Q9185_005681 [Variospora sp. 1 TL-2023]